jgi:hypothetical protein
MIYFYLYICTYTKLYYTYHGTFFDLFLPIKLYNILYVQKVICSDVIRLVFLSVQTLYVKYLYVKIYTFRRYTLRRYTYSIYTFIRYTFGRYTLCDYTFSRRIFTSFNIAVFV